VDINDIPISIAIASMVSTIRWDVKNDFDITTINWYDTEVERPTDESIQLVRQQMADEKSTVEYISLRQNAYPSYADQFDTIFHEGVDEWKAQIQAVKDKYPKP